MRNAVLRLPTVRSSAESRHVFRTAIRQLERAGLYLAAVEALDLGDPESARALRKLLADLEGLRRYLVELRVRT